MPRAGVTIGVTRSRSSASRFKSVRSFSTSNTSSSITLNWLAPSSGTPTIYQVQRSSDGVTWGNQQSVTPPTTTYTYSGLSTGTYYVRVRAVYATGNSSWVSSGAISTSYPLRYTLGFAGYTG